MRLVRVLAVTFLLAGCAEMGSLLHDSHSVEAIEKALRSPIPAHIHQRARQFDDQLLRTGRIDDDRIEIVTDGRHARVNRITSQLLTALRYDPSRWVVRVLDTTPPIENAFVLGGTYIYVYTGLVQNASADDELAFVLAHEIGHSLLKHSARREEDFLNLVASLVQLRGATSRSPDRREKYTLMGGAMKASYSREDEQEADALAAVVAKRAGFDPLLGIQFFNRAQREEAGAYVRVEQQLANERANAERAIHNCNQIQATWNSSAAYRTQRNASIVNVACQDAQARADRYNDLSRRYFYQVRRAPLLRTQPPDRNRIAALAATVDYLNGRRPLNSLGNIGQGYRVLVALERLRASANPTSR